MVPLDAAAKVRVRELKCNHKGDCFRIILSANLGPAVSMVGGEGEEWVASYSVGAAFINCSERYYRGATAIGMPCSPPRLP